MTDMMTVLSELPADLRPGATRLWQRTERVTNEATETLMYSYRVLGAVPGDPELLQDGADLLRSNVADGLAQVATDLNSCHSEVSQAWQGYGSESFRQYMPRLTGTISDLQQSANDTASAVTAFQESLVLLWARLLNRVDRTADEVGLAVVAAGPDRQQAALDVIDLVEQFATYVEELAEALMHMETDSHPAGRTLSQAVEPIAGLVEDAHGYRLPKPGDDMSSDWQPVHSNVWVDTRAMAGLTATLSDSGQAWREAARSGEVAKDRFTPDAFGLAGADFQPRLHAVLERDVSAYQTADRHLEELADTLRRIGHTWIVADDAVAEELGRGQDQE